ncbi:DNA primase family protein [Stenotrophomonas acidaminiphila]
MSTAIANQNTGGTAPAQTLNASQSSKKASNAISTPNKPSKKFKVSEAAHPSWNFANYMLKGFVGDWAFKGGIPYKWVNTHWQNANKNEHNVLPTEFFNNYMQDKASNAACKDAWSFAVNTLAAKSPLPEKQDGTVLAVKNGYVHVADAGDITFHPADKKLGLTFCVNATVSAHYNSKYVPQDVPSNSMFGKFLETSLPKKSLREFIQEQCALSLLPGPHQLAFWWYSDGGDGKGTMMNILRGFHQNVATVKLHLLHDPTHLASCINASIVLTTEVQDGRWKEEEWKAFTGGDLIKAKLLYKDQIEFVNEATHYISSNKPPFVTDPTNGVYRRMCIVEWQRVKSGFERIEQLDKKILKEEAHLVLDWLLQGLQRIVKRGKKFLPEDQWPEEARFTKQQVRFSNDCISAWAHDCNGKADQSHLTPKTALYANYEKWCTDNDRVPLAANQFWRKIWSISAFSSAKPKTTRGDTMRFNGSQVNAVRITIDGVSNKHVQSTDGNEFLAELESLGINVN